MDFLQDPKVKAGAAVVGGLASLGMTIFKPQTKAYKISSWLVRALGGVLGAGVLAK